MASMPARQPSQRRSSPTEQSSQGPAEQTQSSASHVSPVRARSEDSQTIFVQRDEDGEENANGQDQHSQEDEKEEERQPGQNVPPVNVDDDPSNKRCWICFSESNEDTPQTSPWKDPCPCALVAHEECLLDWIADMETPNRSRQRGSVAAPKIECPQCKSEIKLARPRSVVVDAVNYLDRLSGKLVTPGAILTLSGVVYSSSLAWGIHSIYAVFGAEDGFRILRPWIANATRAPVEVYLGSSTGVSKQLFNIIIDHLVHWRLYVGLPLISPVLILSRTSLADNFLPVLPIFFFATQAHSPTEALEFGQWPPSASFVFALLPYVRSMYNASYEKIWGQKVRGWLKEIQPRSGQDQAGDQNNANGAANQQDQQGQVGDDENVFEVRIDGGIWEDWEEAEELEERLENNAANPAAPQPVEDDPAAPAPVVQDNRPEPQGDAANPNAAAAAPPPAARNQQQNNRQAAAAGGNGERRLSFSPTAIAETVIGALLFPTIAGITGEALKLVLPTAWTTPPILSSRFGDKYLARGLLQYKWARSVVGGCLFVVCKDALMLYVRWKMAQMHRNRSVLNYDRSKDATRTK